MLKYIKIGLIIDEQCKVLNNKGKGAKIATVNLKMGNYNSGKLKGAKLYTVN